MTRPTAALAVAVGMPVTRHPPRRSGRALLTQVCQISDLHG